MSIPSANSVPDISDLDLSEDERAFLINLLELEQALPETRQAVGNKTLREKMVNEVGWDEQQYVSTRKTLLDKEHIELGRGKGGSVKTLRYEALPPEQNLESIAADDDKKEGDGRLPSTPKSAERQKESELYDPLMKVIESTWTSENSIEALGVEKTAGNKQGKWGNPDITCAEVRRYEYVTPKSQLNIHTFEVKPSDMIDVTAVYEALSHRRRATHAYVLLHVPEEKERVLETTIEVVCSTAREHGIGVITAGDPHDFDTWDTKERASRTEPDPLELEQFVRKQLSAKLQEKIRKNLG